MGVGSQLSVGIVHSEVEVLPAMIDTKFSDPNNGTQKSKKHEITRCIDTHIVCSYEVIRKKHWGTRRFSSFIM